MTPAEVTVLSALGVSDESAEMRIEIERLIRAVVQDELRRQTKYDYAQITELQRCVQQVISDNRPMFEKLTMQTIKSHFQNQYFG